MFCVTDGRGPVFCGVPLFLPCEGLEIEKTEDEYSGELEVSCKATTYWVTSGEQKCNDELGSVSFAQMTWVYSSWCVYWFWMTWIFIYVGGCTDSDLSYKLLFLPWDRPRPSRSFVDWWGCMLISERMNLTTKIKINPRRKEPTRILRPTTHCSSCWGQAERRFCALVFFVLSPRKGYSSLTKLSHSVVEAFDQSVLR